jgi:hypothetical protein
VSSHQQVWLDALGVTSVETYLWRPNDWDTIVEVFKRSVGSRLSPYYLAGDRYHLDRPRIMRDMGGLVPLVKVLGGISVGFGSMYSAVGVFWRRVDRVQLEVFGSSVDNVVPYPSGNDDRPVVLNLMALVDRDT